MKGIIFVVVFIALVCGVAGRVRRDEATLDQILTTNHTEFVKLLNTYNPTLYNLIKSATSADALTLFVPTDEAIKTAINGKIPNATNTLEYHAHRGDLVRFYLRDFHTIPTLYVSPRLPGPQVLSFSAVNGTSNVTLINYQAQIIGADVTASNGMIHVIDQVLNVPYEDVIRAADIGNFKHLQNLVKIANFTDPESTANVTLLAPTDIAFTALFDQQPILKAYFSQNKLPSVKSTIQNLLTKHVIKGVFYPATLANGTTLFDSVFGSEVKVDKTFNNITVSLDQAKATVAAVTIPNLIAADGVAHGINQVLTVPGQGLLSLSDILNTLNATNYIARLNATGLIDILEDRTPRTYFVPLDSISGVNSLNASDILYGIAQLPDVTFSGRYIDSSLFLPSLRNGSQQLFVETSPINNVTRAPKVNGIIATGPAITNKGSYVYSINTLLIVPGVPENVLNAAGDNNFTAFTSLYSEKTLSNTGLYDINNNRTTLFVPTNEAFSKLPLGVVGFLRVNDTTAKQYATEILNNHIVEDGLLYNIDQGQTQLVSADKQVLNVNRNSGGVTVSGPGYTAAVNPVALLTNNGAAFPIDSVLVPQGVKLTAEEILQGLAFENTTGESLGQYYTSIQHFDQVGLLDLLRSRNGEQYTLFVYTDAAWDNAAQSYAGVSNHTDELEQLTNIINYGIVYGESVQDLNKSNVLVPGHNSNSTITVIQAGPDEKTKVSLKTLQGTYEATVVVSTVTGYNQAIYGLDRVLGVDSKDTSKGNKLPTWAWVVIIVGGILIGLLILAVIVGAAWYLFVRPNREGYRHIN